MEILLVFIILVFLLGSIGLFFTSRSDIGMHLPGSRKTGKSGTGADKLAVKKMRMVKINPGFISCLGARKIASQTYLETEAPALPLAQCPEEKCLCKYTFLDDRRGNSDRRAIHEYLGGFLQNHETDRRQYSGRRTTDILV